MNCEFVCIKTKYDRKCYFCPIHNSKLLTSYWTYILTGYTKKHWLISNSNNNELIANIWGDHGSEGRRFDPRALCPGRCVLGQHTLPYW